MAPEWAELVALKGSPAQALDAISRPEPGIIGYYRRLTLVEGSNSPAGRAAMEEQEAVYRLAESMRDAFKAMLASGRLIGTGIYRGTGLRQQAPPEVPTTILRTVEQ